MDTKKLSIICIAIILVVVVSVGMILNNQSNSTVKEPAQVVEPNSDVDEVNEDVEEQDSFVTVGGAEFVVPSGYKIRSNSLFFTYDIVSAPVVAQVIW